MKKFIMIGLLALFALSVSVTDSAAQSRVSKFYNLLGTALETDTCTNSGTAVVEATATGISEHEVVIQAVLTEISGTTGGTLTLQGSIDGTNFVTAANTLAADSASAYANVTYQTFTPTDVASQSYIWRIVGSPYIYYRLSWTGTGTMSGTLRGWFARR